MAEELRFPRLLHLVKMLFVVPSGNASRDSTFSVAHVTHVYSITDRILEQYMVMISLRHMKSEHTFQ